jgi:hypothetical protein
LAYKEKSYSTTGGIKMAENRYELNKQLAQMLKGGVIMDVTTPEQAKIAEAAGAGADSGGYPGSGRCVPYE